MVGCTCRQARDGRQMRCFRRAMTDSPLSAASMSVVKIGEGEVRLEYDSIRARLAARGSSSSAGVPFGAIVSCTRSMRMSRQLRVPTHGF